MLALRRYSRYPLNTRLFAVVLFLLGAVLAACGGGGGSGPGAPGTAPPTASTPAPLASSFIVAGGGSVLSVGPVGTVDSTALEFAAASSGSGATVSYAISDASPPDGPALSLSRLTHGEATGLWFITLSTNRSVLFNTAPSFTFQLDGVASNVQYYLALYTSTSGTWIEPWEGPGTVAGSSVTFLPASSAFSIAPGVTYMVALYTLSTATPSPSASPSQSASPSSKPSASASPSASPSASVSPSTSPSSSPSPGALSASPNPLNAGQTGALTLYVTEQGYSGAYNLTSDNTSVVAVPGTVNATNPTTAITVTAVNAGTAHVTITDSHGQAVTVTVVVTTTPVTISLLPHWQGWKGR